MKGGRRSTAFKPGNQFAKGIGCKGKNPGAKAILRDIRDLAKAEGREAISTLSSIMRSISLSAELLAESSKALRTLKEIALELDGETKGKATGAIKTLSAILEVEMIPPAARVAAANVLLDRGYGKPEQTSIHIKSPLDDLSDDGKRALIEEIERIERERSAPPEGSDSGRLN